MTFGCGVGDILSGVLPADFVTVVLHKPDEMLPAPGLGHALVNGDLQVHLPAIALGIGTVLPVGHGAFLFLLLLGSHNRKAVLHTQLVRSFSQSHETFLVAVVFETCIAAYGIDHEVIVQMLPVCMGGNDNLIAGDMLCQLQGDLVSHLRGDRIVRTEGLDLVEVHSSLGASIQPLGLQAFQQGSLGYTVDPGNQGATFVCNLPRQTAVGDDTVQTTNGLRLLAFRKFNDCHDYHRFRLRISDSRELTCAYATVSS